MSANFHELCANLLADLLVLSERRSIQDLCRSLKAKYPVPHHKLDEVSAESIEASRNDCSARRPNDAIIESIKFAIERIKIVQLNATVGKIQDIHKDELDFSQVILRFSQSVLFRYFLKNCISYEPLRRTGSKCGVHFRAISNELQSPAHCYI